jgi:hypothetical protein
MTPHQIFVLIIGGSCAAMLAGLLAALFIVVGLET